jgi:hypothetical protein
MSGFKDFADGNYFTAAEVDGYLMRQSIPRFTDTATLLTQLGSGIREKGMLAWADDTETLYMYSGTGSTWVPVFSTEKNYGPATWTGSTTNPVKGNGVEIAKYWVAGGMVNAHWKFTLGTTTTIGSGDYAWTLPVAAATDYPISIVGTGIFQDVSAGGYYPRYAVTVGNAGSFRLLAEAGTRFGSTTPIAPASTDIIDITLRYRSTALDIT